MCFCCCCCCCLSYGKVTVSTERIQVLSFSQETRDSLVSKSVIALSSISSSVLLSLLFVVYHMAEILFQHTPRAWLFHGRLGALQIDRYHRHHHYHHHHHSDSYELHIGPVSPTSCEFGSLLKLFGEAQRWLVSHWILTSCQPHSHQDENLA